MTTMTPEEVLVRVRAAHDAEWSLIEGLTDGDVRAPSTLPGWTRGHVLGARLAFLLAAARQTAYATEGRSGPFYEGGRSGRDAEIEVAAAHHAADLVSAVRSAAKALEEVWCRMGPPDWGRPVTYRGPGTLEDVLVAAWREAQLHRVDLGLGVRPSAWCAELCAHLIVFLAPRVPEGTRLDVTTPEGRSWSLGSGARVEVHGALTDVAAWMAGRTPEAAVTSSTGALPALARLGDPRSER